MKLIETLPVNNLLGEGIVWHPDQTTFWWTDILASKLYCYHWQQKALTYYSMPEPLGCFGFVEDSETIIAAFASGIALYHLTSGEVQWLARPEKQNKGNRFNDGGVDRQGRFWAGTMVEDEALSTEKGQLYSLSLEGECHTRLEHISISNSLCWSPDGEIIYHADSPSHCIYQYQITEGKLTNKHLFAQTPETMVPDGACIDSRGHLWSAQWGGSYVVEYDKFGNVISTIPLPVSQPTCVAIGGPNLDILCITSAKQGLSDEQLSQQPNAGDIFIYQLEKSVGITECYADISGYPTILAPV